MLASSHSTTLRRFHAKDLDPFLAYRDDPEIARFQSWEAMSREKAAGFIAHMASIDPLLRPGHWTQIAIAQTATDDLIGDMGLYLSNDGLEAEIGITLARSSHGQGHAMRACQLAVGLLFDRTAITRINAFADARNTASRRLCDRLGFTFVGSETTDGVEEAVFISHRPE